MASWEPPPLPARFVAASHLPLVGRRSELGAFEAAWSEVEQRRRQLIFVGGEPGAGKTRLVAEIARVLAGLDVTVLVGTSSADAGMAYQPFSELLDHLFTTTAEGALRDLVGGDARELRRLTAQVARHCGDLPAEHAETGDVRRDLFDAVSGFLGRLAAERPLVLVLDDLQWAHLPTLALLEHLARVLVDVPLLMVATFRTTAPDRSDEVAARVAELHRLEGVRRLDLAGLDTEAIAEFVHLRSGLPLPEARAPAALLRDRTGGNPFFLRELWADLERRGGIAALRAPQRAPASISDALQARIAGLGEEVRKVLELAAVLGDDFDVQTLISASGVDMAPMGFVDAATALGLIDRMTPDGARFAFVHALTRQAVLDRLPPSRRAALHARAAQALERDPVQPTLVPRLAQHYLAAQVLGFHAEAVRYCAEAGRLAEASLAFEEAASWFERAASLPETDTPQRSQLLLAAAADYVRACHFPRARAIYAQLSNVGDPEVRLVAAMGFEEATWRPGVLGTQAADLLTTAIESFDGDRADARYVRAVGSLGRALALAGETERAREVGSRAIELARGLADHPTWLHTLTTALWHGITPDMAETQLERSTEVCRAARQARDFEGLGAGVNFRATVSYLLGRPDDLREATADAKRAAEATGQPYYRHAYCCIAHAHAFMHGDFATAERWATATLEANDPFDDEIAEGPYGVQMFMVRRETAGLDRFAGLLDGSESFEGRWVPGLLALYTELDVPTGTRRALEQMVDRAAPDRVDEATWPMELAFMTEAALALGDAGAAERLRPLLAAYAGRNLVSGTMIATFGSADRLLGRVASLLGDDGAARRHLDVALEMDRRMRSVVHVAETLAHQALLAAGDGHGARADALAREARDLAASTGQQRVLRLLDGVAVSSRPAGLSEREVDVLRLVAAGLSNQDIGDRLHISTNTAANHIRSILMKTGAANRTQAAIFAAQHDLA